MYRQIFSNFTVLSVTYILTGTECPPQRTQALANANPCVPSSAALISNNFPMPYNGFETSYWVLCFPDEGNKLYFLKSIKNVDWILIKDSCVQLFYTFYSKNTKQN